MGSELHGKKVLALEKMPDLAQRMKIHLGILTVPAEAAQEVCDLMVANGIRAIWNFAPTALSAPEEVIIQSEDLFSSLGVLSSRLAAALRAED